ARASEGVFAVGLGTILVGIVGGFSTIVYPDNIGIIRTSRVASRYATMAAGVLLIVLGGSVKFDMLLVVVPTPVLTASATLLFGIVFMHGVQMLGRVNWDDRAFIAAGLAIMVGIGGLFVPPDALAQMPLWLRLLVQQPVISGGLTVVILHALLGRETAAAPSR
ncbi:MAG TPA: solute carrier family 23 protein, partial [Stellaceae bacterium]|nr:solute carrier family 23 protein [Stellaceae bacterium]